MPHPMRIASRLREYHLLPSVRGDLLERVAACDPHAVRIN